MKKRKLLYVPLVLMFLFVGSALVIHYSNSLRLFSVASRDVQLPFFINGAIRAETPETAAADLALGDRLIGLNGKVFGSETEFQNEFSKIGIGEPVIVIVERKAPDGQSVRLERTVTATAINKDFTFYSRIVVGFVWAYLIPTICALLGLWVVLVRPRDPLAWLLLFLLLGVASNGFEGYPRNSYVGFFRSVFFTTWSLSMLLFGIYFPERWSVDKKIPWAKWIFIVPLSLQILLMLLNYLKLWTGVILIDYLTFVAQPYERIAAFLNMAAIGMFFAALGHKSGTLENSDARRRLKLTVTGTSVAMLPSFIVILYAVATGRTGSFFEVVPWWFALSALGLMLVFPLTMAYVIIVHRAMDVSVVVRQGLQYALARNGVLALQVLLSVSVIAAAASAVSEASANRPQKISFVAFGVAAVFLIRLGADKIRGWTDRRFFREAYNAEQILSELSEDVRTMVETKPLLETVSTRISESLHVPQIALLLRNGNNVFQPAYALGYENVPSVEFSESDRTFEKLKNNEPLTIYQDDADSWVNEEVEEAERAKLQKLNSRLLLPIGAKDNLSGVISLSPKRSEEPYTPNDLRLLKSVAAQTGLALENSRLTETIAREAAQKERLNRELEIAREVQERLFPQELPATEGLDYIGACRPALGVGGDYYDFLELPDGRFGIAIGDVSGKGIGASLMMASLQASLRGQSIHCGSNLAELMSHVNTLVYEASTSNRYATFFYAQLDTKTRRLIYVNAGHNPPFLLRKNGDVLRLEEGGAVVGMLPTMFVNYTQGEVQLEPGDLLVGYTDGISEAMNPAEEEWSEEAMLAELKNVYGQPSEEILNHIIECADRFADGAKQHDDMTAIIVKII